MLNFAQNFISRFGAAVLSFGMVWVAARLTGAEGRGEIALFVTNLTVVQLFNQFIGGSSLSYFASRYQRKSLLAPSYIWAVIVSISAGVIITYLYSNTWLTILFTLCTLFDSLSNIYLCLLLGHNKPLNWGWLQLLRALLILISFLFFYSVLPLDTLLNYSISSLISFTILTILASISLPREEIGLPLIKSLYLIKQSVTLQVSNFLSFGNYRLSYYLILAFVTNGIHELGIYSTAVALSESVWLIGRTAASVVLAGASNEKDEKNLKQLLESNHRIVILLSALSCMMLAIIPTSVFTLIFGSDFVAIKKYTLILLPGILVSSSFKVLAGYFSGTGRFSVNTLINLAGIIVLMLSSFLFIPSMGLEGAALSTSISYVVMSLTALLYYSYATGWGLADLFLFRLKKR